MVQESYFASFSNGFRFFGSKRQQGHPVLNCWFPIFFAILLLTASAIPAKEQLLLSPKQLAPFSLTRNWFNQLEIDFKKTKVLHVTLEGDSLFVVTDNAQLHVLDSETGKVKWIRTLGDKKTLLQEPATNSRMVAVVTSMELFVFDRRNGKLLLTTPLAGAVSAACEMSENYVYVPMLGGRILAFPLEDTSIQMEDVDDPFEATASKKTSILEEESDTEDSPQSNDPYLDNIIKQFKATKESILAEPEPLPKEKEILLKKAQSIPMVCQSFGNLMVPPKLSSQVMVFTERNHVRMHREVLVWVTNRGYLFAAGINNLSQSKLELQYMVDSSAQAFYFSDDKIARQEMTQNKEIVSRPSSNQCYPYYYTDNRDPELVIPSMIVTGSKGDYVFAVRDRTGEVAWQFAAKGPILERIAIIGKDVYCPTGLGGMHALCLLTGTEKWYYPGITQFISASKKRLYLIDKLHQLVILDRSTGGLIGKFDARKHKRILFNMETDRLYFVDDSGLIQCIAERQPQSTEEIAQAKPILPIQHRLTQAQYVQVWTEKKGTSGDDEAETESEIEEPKLYWLHEDDSADSSANPFASPTDKKRPSGDDGSLDGNEFDDDSSEDDEDDMDMEEEDDEDEDADEEDPFA